jgi:hypothetical protein
MHCHLSCTDISNHAVFCPCCSLDGWLLEYPNYLKP